MTSGMKRCGWCGDDPLYVQYHDTEWGVPERDDRALYEKLMLDGFQAGLSWITILRKRENFRAAFKGFEPDVIAHWGARDVNRLLKDAGIIRHRGKIEAAIGNARAVLDIQNSGQSFADFLWQFTGGQPKINRWTSMKTVPAVTKDSEAMSQALKQAGFKFCGPTICYAFMQAVGMVNDHMVSCHRYTELGGKA